MSKKYDFIIVGAGLFGATFAYEALKSNRKCLVLDRRNHLGGNVYCQKIEGINIHKYGPHIFHTNNRMIWNYINQFTSFNRFTLAPIANFKGEIYNLPFNMNTFNKIWGVVTPEEAKVKIEEERKRSGITDPKNLEEQAISLVGIEIYEKLIKGYSEKQWGRKARDLPAFLIKRLPVRFTYDNNYFNDRYQGIPIKGYNRIIEKMLDGVDVKLKTDFIKNRNSLTLLADKIVYTGMIDEYFDFRYGCLQYRSLKFKNQIIDQENYQGNAVVNYPSIEKPYTRIIEHKHFEFGNQPNTVITREYPIEWKKGMESYYPINDKKNNNIYNKYKKLAKNEKNTIFGGRLGEYKYLNMDEVIQKSLELANRIL